MSTGAASHDLFKISNLDHDKNGFLLVNDNLQSLKYNNIFGGGDCI